MSCRVMLAVALVSGGLVGEIRAQGGGAPSILVKVNKAPGGKGRVVSYDLEKETLMVALKAPGGRTNQVEVSRRNVSPRAWRFLSEIARAAKAAQDKTLLDEPIEVEVKNIPGGKGTIVAFNADTNAVVVDFGGQRSREIPVSQLKQRTWKAAVQKMGRTVPPTKDKNAEEPADGGSSRD